jgi:outer membrane protein assembly factor BamB
MPHSVKFLASRLALHLLLASFAGAPAWSANASPPSPLPHASANTLSVDVISGNISRMLVSGTSVMVEVEIAPVGFSFTRPLHAVASDPDNVFEKAVKVMERSGTYVLALTTSTLLGTGDYQKEVSIELCANAACTEFQAVKSIKVPYRIDALSTASAWPGNHVTPLAAWPGVPDWTMFQGNAAHTGFVPVELDPDQITTRWQQPARTVSSGYSSIIASTATSDGQLFVSGDDHLYALEEFDGSTNWSYDFHSLPFPSVNPAGIADGIVYVAAGQQSSTYLFAFKAKSGGLVFKSAMSSQWENYLAPTIGTSGIYTDAGTYGGLYGFAASGAELFFATEEQTSLWTPAVDANGVYSYTGYLQVNDPVTGAVTHAIPDPTFENYIYEIGGSPVIGAPGSIFMANYENSIINGGGIGNTLLNFQVASNSIAWKIPGDYPTTPAYAKGRLYVGNNNPMQLEVRAESDGSLIWSWVPPQAGDIGFISEVLLTKNLVFVSTNLATYAVDLSTHSAVWSVPLVGKLSLSKNGVLYIQAADEISAFNVK